MRATWPGRRWIAVKVTRSVAPGLSAALSDCASSDSPAQRAIRSSSSFSFRSARGSLIAAISGRVFIRAGNRASGCAGTNESRVCLTASPTAAPPGRRFQGISRFWKRSWWLCHRPRYPSKPSEIPWSRPRRFPGCGSRCGWLHRFRRRKRPVRANRRHVGLRSGGGGASRLCLCPYSVHRRAASVHHQQLGGPGLDVS